MDVDLDSLGLIRISGTDMLDSLGLIRISGTDMLDSLGLIWISGSVMLDSLLDSDFGHRFRRASWCERLFLRPRTRLESRNQRHNTASTQSTIVAL